MNMLLIYLFASMKLEKGHKKLLGSNFKIMLRYDISQHRLKYYTERPPPLPTACRLYSTVGTSLAKVQQ